MPETLSERSLKPSAIDQAADIDIPRQTYSNWIPSVGLRPLRRSLTQKEVSIISRRVNELETALTPHHVDDRVKVRAAVSLMLNGFRALRSMGDDVSDTSIRIIVSLLAPYPLWAIQDVCRSIASGQASRNDKFPPNDSEIVGMTENAVRPYRDRLTKAKAILAAPIDNVAPSKPKPTLTQEPTR